MSDTAPPTPPDDSLGDDELRTNPQQPERPEANQPDAGPADFDEADFLLPQGEAAETTQWQTAESDVFPPTSPGSDEEVQPEDFPQPTEPVFGAGADFALQPDHLSSVGASPELSPSDQNFLTDEDDELTLEDDFILEPGAVANDALTAPEPWAATSLTDPDPDPDPDFEPLPPLESYRDHLSYETRPEQNQANAELQELPDPDFIPASADEASDFADSEEWPQTAADSAALAETGSEFNSPATLEPNHAHEADEPQLASEADATFEPDEAFETDEAYQSDEADDPDEADDSVEAADWDDDANLPDLHGPLDFENTDASTLAATLAATSAAANAHGKHYGSSGTKSSKSSTNSAPSAPAGPAKSGGSSRPALRRVGLVLIVILALGIGLMFALNHTGLGLGASRETRNQLLGSVHPKPPLPAQGRLVQLSEVSSGWIRTNSEKGRFRPQVFIGLTPQPNAPDGALRILFRDADNKVRSEPRNLVVSQGQIIDGTELLRQLIVDGTDGLDEAAPLFLQDLRDSAYWTAAIYEGSHPQDSFENFKLLIEIPIEPRLLPNSPTVPPAP